MNKRRASLVKRSCVRVDGGEESLVETRLEVLEATHADLGARLAGLEGVVFALQHRVKELERALKPVTTSTAPREPQNPVARPHLAARRR